MDPFNIRVTDQEQNITLTVLPCENRYYKIIYYAAVLTAVKKDLTGDWMLINKDDIEAGDLPFYLHTDGTDRIEPSLNKTFAEAVGSAIELELGGGY